MDSLLHSRLRHGIAKLSYITISGLLAAIGSTAIPAHDVGSIIAKSAILGGGSAAFVVGGISAYSALRVENTLDSLAQSLTNKRANTLDKIHAGQPVQLAAGRCLVAEIYINCAEQKILDFSQNCFSNAGLRTFRDSKTVAAEGRVGWWSPYAVTVSVTPYADGVLATVKSISAHFIRDRIVPELLEDLASRVSVPV